MKITEEIVSIITWIMAICLALIAVIFAILSREKIGIRELFREVVVELRYEYWRKAQDRIYFRKR